MYTAFPCSDYYGSSAPLRRHQPATGLPHQVGRDQRSGSHVHSRTLQRGRCPAMPLQLRHGYAAVLPHGLPAGDIYQPRSSPTGQTRRVCVATQPLSVRLELVVRALGAFRRWFLAYTFPSRLPDPRHLTVLARPVVVRAASTLADVPRVGLPSASFSLLRQADGGGLSPPQGSRTPRGARCPRTTRDWAARWPIP